MGSTQQSIGDDDSIALAEGERPPKRPRESSGQPQGASLDTTSGESTAVDATTVASTEVMDSSTDGAAGSEHAKSEAAEPDQTETAASAGGATTEHAQTEVGMMPPPPAVVTHPEPALADVGADSTASSIPKVASASTDSEPKKKVEVGSGPASGSVHEEAKAKETKWKRGERAACRWDDSSDKVCEILDIREYRDSAGEQKNEYYVHYVDFDRRLDGWVREDRMSECIQPSEADQLALVAENKDGGFLTRNQRRKLEEAHIGEASHAAHESQGEGLNSSIQAQMEKEHFENTKVKNIRCIQLGRYEVDCWYFAPYPDGYSQDKLYICEYCLKYYKQPKTLQKCCCEPKQHRPPGTEIYNDGLIAVFEVDGRENKLYCQCLCLLAKLFLDHKTLYYDVEPFLFYVFTEIDGKGDCHVIAYFSKEKFSADDYNLACILTLPPYQRKGFGKFVIAFSYELSKVERKMGTPERPLSDLGQLSYRSYWAEVLVQLLWKEKTHKRITHSTVEEMSQQTFIKQDDIVSTLQSYNLVQYWKGQYIVNPNSRLLEEHAKTIQAQVAKRLVKFKPEALNYTPRVWELPSYDDD